MLASCHQGHTNVDRDGSLDRWHGVERQSIIRRVGELVPIFQEGLPFVGHIKKFSAGCDFKPWLTCTAGNNA